MDPEPTVTLSTVLLPETSGVGVGCTGRNPVDPAPAGAEAKTELFSP